MQSPCYAGVVVETPLTDKFHYKIPDQMTGIIEPGDRVVVPFGRRKIRGVVVEIVPRPPIDQSLLKEIESVAPSEERIPGDILHLANWTAKYYGSSWGTVLSAAIPAGIKQGARQRVSHCWRLMVTAEQFLEAEAKAQRRAPRRARTLKRFAELVAMKTEWSAEELREDAEISADVFPHLAENGFIYRFEEAAPTVPILSKRPELTPSQQNAVTAIEGAVRSRDFGVFLLHGVTGSGKTEVYLRLMEQALAAGRGVLVLVPEISLTPQTVERFQSRAGDVAVLHSNLGDGERAEQWRRLRSGAVRVAVGARSAVFAPIENLGLVVVDEEHERTYKQENDPRYNARDVAIVRASHVGAAVVLGSATPSLESWNNAIAGKYTLLSLPERAGGAVPPAVSVVDLRREWADVKKPAILSRELERSLAACLNRGEQAILFLNRRGFHTSVRCAGCGEPVECQSCDIALTYHRMENILRCHCCGSQEAPPEKCPICSSKQFRYVGTGTERVEDILTRIYPGVRLLRMDSDSMTGRDAHASALSRFAAGGFDVLLGTQMIAKGLDFPNVTLVGVLMADSALGMTDFRAAERTFQLTTQVIGRAGRGVRPGLAIVQAFQPEHPAVSCAVNQDYQAFVDGELVERKRLAYPPFGRLARILVTGGEEAAVASVADKVGQLFRESLPSNGRLLGPAECELARAKALFRRHLLLLCPDHNALARWIARAKPPANWEKGVRVAVDIDPVSLQ